MSCLCEFALVSSLSENYEESSRCYAVPNMCGTKGTKCSIEPLAVVERVEGCIANPRPMSIGQPPEARLMRETHTRANGCRFCKDPNPGKWQ